MQTSANSSGEERNVLDLDAYFRRIGYQGSLDPTLDTLQRIHFAHTINIPFENLDVLLGKPISLELGDIQRKLVTNHRGGYCFEQNRLLGEILIALGFRVTGLAARVRKGSTAIRPRTHMILKVELEGVAWLVDVGFGSEGILYPIRLDQSEAIEQHAWSYRICEEGDLLVLQTLYQDGWFDLYAFTQEPQHPVDYLVANHFTQTHSRSPFTYTLLVQKSTAVVRKILLNRQFILARAGVHEIKRIADDGALLKVLDTEFGLQFPDGTCFKFTEEDGPLS